jgi:DNA-binding NarL/FixJ family response regulator
LARELRPDVFVTDVSMPGLNGVDAIRRIHAEEPGVRMLCLSMHDTSRTVLAALDAGARGYVLKEGPGEELGRAIRKVMANQVYLSPELVGVVVDEMRHRHHRPPEVPGEALTPRERELVQLLSEGYSTAEVAERLHVSVKTVATHREHVMHKLDLHSVAELTRYALREGLTSMETPCGEAHRRRATRAG